jgi:hypothetical protein
LVTAEEEDVATLNFLHLTYQADVKYSGSEGLAIDGALQYLAARFVVEDAKFEGRIAIV